MLAAVLLTVVVVDYHILCCIIGFDICVYLKLLRLSALLPFICLLAHALRAISRSLEDALADPLCDAVWIAGPTPLHKECIRMAAEAGKVSGPRV